MRTIWKFALAGVVATGMHVESAKAQETTPEIIQLQEAVRSVLIDTPEILQEAIQAYVENQNRIRDEEHKGVAKANFKNSLGGPLKDIDGEPNEDTLILVEFFDYRCPHCRSGASLVKEYLRKDGNTKFYLVELPILGEESSNIAKISISAWEQTVQAQAKGTTLDYFEFHDALIDASASELPDTKRALELAHQFGYDMDMVRAALSDSDVNAIIEANHKLAQEVGIRSTPGFLLFSLDGSQIEGFVGAETPDFIAETAKKVREAS